MSLITRWKKLDSKSLIASCASSAVLQACSILSDWPKSVARIFPASLSSSTIKIAVSFVFTVSSQDLISILGKEAFEEYTDTCFINPSLDSCKGCSLHLIEHKEIHATNWYGFDSGH